MRFGKILKVIYGGMQMKKTITIYELLGLIKDNKAPKKIKYEYLIYELTPERNDYYCKNEMRWFTNEINSLGVLNDEVEILDEEEFEDIEEITIRDKIIGFSNGEWTARNMDKAFSIKINQLIKNQKKIIEKLNKEN